jgi:hypothetical protein
VGKDLKVVSSGYSACPTEISFPSQPPFMPFYSIFLCSKYSLITCQIEKKVDCHHHTKGAAFFFENTFEVCKENPK